MRLEEYLKENNLSQVKFAKMIGVTPPVISYMVKRKKNVSNQVIRRVEKATKGKVLFADLYVDTESRKIKKHLKKHSHGT